MVFFFSDTTWFQGLFDFTVTTPKIQYPANNIIQYNFQIGLNNFDVIYFGWCDFFLQELIHIWSNLSVRLSNRVVLPVLPFVVYPYDLLVSVCQNCLLYTRLFFLFCVVTIEKWDFSAMIVILISIMHW